MKNTSQPVSVSPFLNYQTKLNLPPLPNYPVTWDLAKLYYKNLNDKNLLADVAYAEQAYKSFNKKWRKASLAADFNLLKKALGEYENLLGEPRISKPLRYLSLRLKINVNDSAAEKLLATIRQRLRIASDQVIFFPLELGKFKTETKRQLLKDPNFSHYHYFLKTLFAGATHHLSEPEEKIIRLKSVPATGLWQDMTEKMISTATVDWKDTAVAIPTALGTLETIPNSEKPLLWDKIIEKIDTFGIPAEHEFNAIIADVRAEDTLRGYKKPYSATALSYEHTETSIEALVQAITSKGFVLSQKFYKLKAKYHGVKQLPYPNKYDALGVSPTISFAEAVTICRDVFYDVNNDYGKLFDTMLERGQIDVYPRAGKQGGAFMSDETGHPIQVMLNHTDTLSGLETLAHEMGHAIHAKQSATQSPFYDGHSIVTAETASTLFESLVFAALAEQADAETKLALLHYRLTRDIATMQRQIAFFNCELEIHQTIARDGAMTHEELKTCMYKHLRSYLGPAIAVKLLDGASYVYVGHLRYGFYVYSYAFGHLMSSLMAQEFVSDKSYRKQIDTFLTAGASDSVVNIFKKIGIDTTRADTFITALSKHEQDIESFGRLVTKQLRVK